MGCPHGENAAAVGVRADRTSSRVRSIPGDAAVFQAAISCASWPPAGSPWTRRRRTLFYLGTAALSILGCEPGPGSPVIRLWNDTRHVDEQ